MPSHPCRHPTCGVYVAKRGEACPDHQPEARAARADRHRFYDRHQRDPDAKRFYNSGAWQRARARKLADEPVCQRCRRAWANTVHHVKPLKECTPAERVDQENLKALCSPCHNEEEAEADERRNDHDPGDRRPLPEARPGL